MTDNEIIAEFMGFSCIETLPSVDKTITMVWSLESVKGLLHEYHGKFRSDHLRFDTSWDWIKPVVDKISNEHFEKYEEFEKTKADTLLHEFTIFADIDSIHKAVVTFIKWYNTQN